MIVCGWIINYLQVTKSWEYVPACRAIFFVYAGIGVFKFLLTLGLSGRVEATNGEDTSPQQTRQEGSETDPLLANPDREREQTQKQPRQSLFSSIGNDLISLVIRLFVLFALDSFASGLASL